MERVCLTCEAPLIKKPGPGRWPHYCSPECKRARHPDRVCIQCGGAVPPRKRICSDECRRQRDCLRVRDYRASRPPRQRPNTYAPRCAVSFQTCCYCGGLWTVRSRKSAKACRKPECRRALNAETQRRYLANYYATHGVSYHWEHYADQRRALNAAAGFDESRRASYQRRRAAKRGAESERFTNLEIFERDDWLCGICDNPIDPVLAYPEALSVSLDHIVPLSLGGAHTRANTRAAHLTCNIRRGNRVA